MAELESASTATPEGKTADSPGRTPNEVALELMKFIAVTTGYGKTAQSGAGFSSKPQGRSADEHAEALLDLFERCRQVIKKES
jgi:hypothetical protein